MERITLNKNSQLKAIIFAGIEAQGFALVEKLTTRRTPIFVYHNPKSDVAAVYSSRAGDDELLLLDCTKPGKMQVIIAEFASSAEPDFARVGQILKDILEGGRPAKVTTVNVPRLGT